MPFYRVETALAWLKNHLETPRIRNPRLGKARRRSDVKIVMCGRICSSLASPGRWALRSLGFPIRGWFVGSRLSEAVYCRNNRHGSRMAPFKQQRRCGPQFYRCTCPCRCLLFYSSNYAHVEIGSKQDAARCDAYTSSETWPRLHRESEERPCTERGPIEHQIDHYLFASKGDALTEET